MKKLIISAAILLLTGVTAFAVNHYQKSINDNLDPLTKANIEAMRTITTPSTSTGTTSTDISGYYTGDCTPTSIMCKCIIYCTSCSAPHYPTGFYRNGYVATNVVGFCDNCGAIY